MKKRLIQSKNENTFPESIPLFITSDRNMADGNRLYSSGSIVVNDDITHAEIRMDARYALKNFAMCDKMKQAIIATFCAIWVFLTFVSCDSDEQERYRIDDTAVRSNEAVMQCLNVRNSEVQVKCLDVVSKIYTCKIH